MHRIRDRVGRSGVEKVFEAHLRGEWGGQQVEVNATGQVVRVLNTVDAIPGHNVILSIDQALQETAEQMLSGKGGAAVAVEPSTGQILAMASTPSPSTSTQASSSGTVARSARQTGVVVRPVGLFS